MSNPEIADISVIGPVNGTGTRDHAGSYYKVSVFPKHGKPHYFRITGEQVSMLKDECAEIERSAS